jgi:hypothetical protein
MFPVPRRTRGCECDVLAQSYERAGSVASESIAAVRTVVSFGAEEKVGYPQLGNND